MLLFMSIKPSVVAIWRLNILVILMPKWPIVWCGCNFTVEYSCYFWFNFVHCLLLLQFYGWMLLMFFSRIRPVVCCCCNVWVESYWHCYWYFFSRTRPVVRCGCNFTVPSSRYCRWRMWRWFRIRLTWTDSGNMGDRWINLTAFPKE